MRSSGHSLHCAQSHYLLITYVDDKSFGTEKLATEVYIIVINERGSKGVGFDGHVLFRPIH